MRVWLVGRRSGKRRLGGDQLQMEETARVGRSAGWEVLVAERATDVVPELEDRVHLFNIQRCLDWGDLPERTKAAGAQLLLSPLYHPLETYHREGRRGLDGLVSKVIPDPSRFSSLRWGGQSLIDRAASVIQQADRVLLSHVDEASLLRTQFGVELEEEKSHIVPVAVPAAGGPTDTAAIIGKLPAGDFVFCAGRVEPLKNSHLVGRVCSSLGLPLVFAGPSSGLRHAGYARGSLHGAHWIGELDYVTLRQVMARARVHVLASWTEVVGRVSLEAALAGAAVVLSDVGFGPDYLGRGTEGVFLFEAGDEDGLTAALQAAWTRGRAPDSALARRVREHYTWDAVGPRLIEAWSA